MRKEFSTALFPYLFSIFFLGLLTLIIALQKGEENRDYQIYFGILFGAGFAFAVIAMFIAYYHVDLEAKGIRVSSFLGERGFIPYEDIAEIRFKKQRKIIRAEIPPVITSWDPATSRLVASIILKDGSEIAMDSWNIRDLEELITSLQEHLPQIN